jgi:predicted acyltransferase
MDEFVFRLHGGAGVYWLVDVKGYQRGAKPFAIYGVNAITVFMLSGLLGRILLIKTTGPDARPVSWQNYLYERFFDGPLSHLGLTPNVCSLSWAIAWMLGLYAIACVMHRLKWFIKF